uniref:Uncharacterized protein n=1 Tax=Glossina pallidipes TaxID=7398 RepID=A0A1B0A359_GLOPL
MVRWLEWLDNHLNQYALAYVSDCGHKYVCIWLCEALVFKFYIQANVIVTVTSSSSSSSSSSKAAGPLLHLLRI